MEVGEGERKWTRGERLKPEDAMLVDLKMEEGAMSGGMQVASKCWGWQETDSPLESPEGIQPCWHPDFKTSDC